VALFHEPVVEAHEYGAVFGPGVGVRPPGEGALHVVAVREGRVAVVHVGAVLIERAAVLAFAVRAVDPALCPLVGDVEVDSP
jgi:hypothetical protein